MPIDFKSLSSPTSAHQPEASADTFIYPLQAKTEKQIQKTQVISEKSPY